MHQAPGTELKMLPRSMNFKKSFSFDYLQQKNELEKSNLGDDV